MYLRHGEAMAPMLNGIFAFAIWDRKREILFVARDGLGVKPLYFSESPKGFIFASEIKALLEDPGVERQLDPVAVCYYLTYLWSPAPQTILRNVKKLEPGHFMLVKDGRIYKKVRFYDLPYDQPLEDVSGEEAARLLRDAIRLAVERQMVADVPVGAFLSGGLDSSLVAAMAKDHVSNARLQCFTIGFTGEASKTEGMAEDLQYAKKVAEHLGVDLHTIYVGPEMINDLERMIYHLDEPQADPASLNVLFISQLAREHSIKVLLSGAGGDDIFTGYRRHKALFYEKYWEWLPNPFRKGLRDLTQGIYSLVPSARRIAKAFQYSDMEKNDRLASYFYWIDPAVVKNLAGPVLMNSMEEFEASRPLLQSLGSLPENTPDLNRMLYIEGKYFLADHNLRYTDKMSMATGVEVRVPYLDHDLVALAARLPLNCKQNGATGKWVLKKAAEPFLPREVIYRPKTGFGAPLRRWLNAELKPLADDILSYSNITKRGLFDPAKVREIVEMDRRGVIDAAYTIFALICVEVWCRIFLDGAGKNHS